MTYNLTSETELRILLCFVLVLTVVISPIVSGSTGQQAEKKFGSFDPKSEDLNIPSEDGNGKDSVDSGSKIFPTVWCAEITDSETQTVCWAAYRNGLDYYDRGLEHRTKVIEWQHTSTIVIFFVVLFLVGTGIYFAWVQFKSGENSKSNNEIEVSLTGVKVSSPILGVIILVLSLAFFYLYLRYVYPVTEVF